MGKCGAFVEAATGLIQTKTCDFGRDSKMDTSFKLSISKDRYTLLQPFPSRDFFQPILPSEERFNCSKL